MSYSIWVISADDLAWSNHECERLLHAEFPNEDERKVALDKWLDESDKLHLFSEFFGNVRTVSIFWSGIASKLELPMLTSLDEQGGLILETSSQMEELEREV